MDIVDSFLDELITMCQCGLMPSHVDEKAFIPCMKEDNYIIFRARLSGTAEKSSEYLISILEKWVSTSPDIVVQHLQMTVANEEVDCPTALSTYKDVCNKIPSDALSTMETTTTAAKWAIAASGVTIAVALCGGLLATVIKVYKCYKKKGNAVFSIL